jgi:hypothetical protein
MTGIGKQRELRSHWQRACKLILAKEDMLTVSRALELALFHGCEVGRVETLRPDMSEQPIQDINDGKPWSEMDLFDLRNSLAYGRSIEEVAGFLCRSGTVEEVKRKAEELGLLR